MADPGDAGRVGILVRVGQVQVVAAVVPFQHGLRRQRERQTQPRRPGIPDDVRAAGGGPGGKEIDQVGIGYGVQEIGALLLVADAQVQRQPAGRAPCVLDVRRVVPVPVVGGDFPLGGNAEQHDAVHAGRTAVRAVVQIADMSGIGVGAEPAAVDLEFVADLEIVTAAEIRHVVVQRRRRLRFPADERERRRAVDAGKPAGAAQAAGRRIQARRLLTRIDLGHHRPAEPEMLVGRGHERPVVPDALPLRLVRPAPACLRQHRVGTHVGRQSPHCV